MKQIILKDGKYNTLDRKIPTMKALLLTDGTITASADYFILSEIADGAEIVDTSHYAVMPAFIDTCSSFLDTVKKAVADGHDFNEAVKLTSEAYLRAGVVTAAVTNVTEEDLSALKAADAAGALLIDVALYFTEKYEGLVPEKLPVDTKYEGHIRPAGISLIVDDFTTEDALTKVFSGMIEKHHQSYVFADSRHSIDTVMNSYRAALIAVNGSKTDEDGNEKPKIFEDLRPIIAGCAFLADDQLTQLQALGFTPSFNHDNILTQGDTYIEKLETAAYENIYPLRSIVKRGMAFSVNHAGSIPDAVKSMHTETHRNAESGYTLGIEQTINTDQALMSQTLFGSYQLFEDLYKGSLTMTKKADIVILDRNPLENNADLLSKTKVMMVIKDGEIVYRA